MACDEGRRKRETPAPWQALPCRRIKWTLSKVWKDRRPCCLQERVPRQMPSRVDENCMQCAQLTAPEMTRTWPARCDITLH